VFETLTHHQTLSQFVENHPNTNNYNLLFSGAGLFSPSGGLRVIGWERKISNRDGSEASERGNEGNDQ